MNPLSSLEEFKDLDPSELQALMETMLREDPNTYQQLHEVLLSADSRVWIPLPGAQTMAYESKADVVGYGGAAGGGKTALACGLAMNEHQNTAFFRREGTQLEGIVDYMEELMGTRDGYNGQKGIWRAPKLGKKFEFCSTPHPGDETKYQGRPKDLLIVDEAANFLEAMVRFIMGWVRSVDPTQRCRTLLCFNPPTTPEGYWIKSYFAPWLDDNYPNPAEPGELRWFATIGGIDKEVEDNSPVYDEELKKHITPQSRTFIPARVVDNPYLVNTGYMSTLQALPEPLRSQMLYGDFSAGIDDHVYQCIPTAWVDKAMERWGDKLSKKPTMTSMGADVSRGGRDSMWLAPRYGWWYDELIQVPPNVTMDGRTAAAAIMGHLGKGCPVRVDGNGIGASVVDHLAGWGVRHDSLLMQAAATASQVINIPGLVYGNLRAQLYWEFRCILDPNSGFEVALPPDSELRADLTAARYKLPATGTRFYIESKDDIVKRLGRSPDKGDAVVYSSVDTEISELGRNNLPQEVTIKHSSGARKVRPRANGRNKPRRVG